MERILILRGIIVLSDWAIRSAFLGGATARLSMAPATLRDEATRGGRICLRYWSDNIARKPKAFRPEDQDSGS